MDSSHAILWLCASAFGAGAVNSIAGGGTLFTFPALLTILPPVLANATSTVALVPGSLAAGWGFRSHLTEVRRWLAILIWPSLLGGAVGALLLTRLPSHYFSSLVPWLILVATVLFLMQPLVNRFLASRRQPSGESNPTWLVVAQFLVAVYGGYFGGGIGILMLSSLGMMGIGDILQMNALKNILAAAINGVAVVIFVISGQVRWDFAFPMMVASVAGGLLTSQIANRVNKTVVRLAVVAAGLFMTVHFFLNRPT